MPFESSLPAVYHEDPNVIVLNEQQITALDYAEPSPVMLFFSRWWRRLKKAVVYSIFASIVLAYPAMVVASHKIDDSEIVLSSHQNWASPRIGVAINKIARELEGSGWVANAPDWHPKARLTAMPAWQQASVDAMSDHIALLAALAETDGSTNEDLLSASRLLRTLDDAEMRPRLTAAAQALNRFDGHVARNQAVLPNQKETIIAETRLIAGWAETSFVEISRQIEAGASTWPASKNDIEVFYAAKAKAHLASELLKVSAAGELIPQSADINAEFDAALGYWTRASEMSPLFVSNGASDGLLLANNLESMAFYMQRAHASSLKLSMLFEAEDLETSVAASPTDATFVP